MQKQRNNDSGDEYAFRLIVRRYFSSSAEVVFDAWLDNRIAGEWLFATPKGVHRTVEIDPREGGRFRFIEERDDATIEHHGLYLVLDRPRRIEYRVARKFIEPESDSYLAEVHIVPINGGCHVEFCHVIPDRWAAISDQVEAGAAKALMALSKVLREEELSLVIERTFSAPVQLVWDAWTQREHLARWMCPDGFSASDVFGHVRVGGFWQTTMHSPENTTHICRGQYLVVEEPHTLSFTHAWQNDIGGLGHMTTVVVSLKADGDKTHMRFEQTGFRSAESRDQHEHGWTGAFDNVDDLLAEFTTKSADA